MRVFGLVMLLSAAWAVPASAAFVAVDLVFEHQALSVGDRDIWGVWLRTSGDVQVSSLYLYLDTADQFSAALDLSNPYLSAADSIIEPDLLGSAASLLSAYGIWPVPLVRSNASGRIALLTGAPLTLPAEVIFVPSISPPSDLFGLDTILADNTSGSPLSVLSVSGPNAHDCQPGPCEIPTVPRTYSRWLWVVPEPRPLAFVSQAALALACFHAVRSRRRSV